MPKKGYKAITIPEHLANILSDEAKGANRSTPKQIEHMVKQQYPHLRPVQCQCGYVTHVNPRKRGIRKCRNCGGVITT